MVEVIGVVEVEEEPMAGVGEGGRRKLEKEKGGEGEEKKREEVAKERRSGGEKREGEGAPAGFKFRIPSNNSVAHIRDMCHRIFSLFFIFYRKKTSFCHNFLIFLNLGIL